MAIVAFLIFATGEYRVTAEAPWPAQVQDVKAAIRWMRANSDNLGLDPSAIVVAGKSAGGHLAMPSLTLTSHPGNDPDGEPILLDQVGISHISFGVEDVKGLADR